MAEPAPGGESKTDYSGVVRDSARRALKTAGHTHDIASIIRHLPSGRDPRIVVQLPQAQPGDDSSGVRVLDGIPIAAWIYPIAIWCRAHGWTGRISSGYRSVAQQCQACINVCGNCGGCPNRCAAPGTSNHQYTTFPRGAIDVTNEAQFAQVVARYPGPHGLRNDLPLDRVHFSYDGH